VVVLNGARLVMDDTPQKVFLKEDELKGIGLDVPYVARIASALRVKGMNIDNDVIRLDELEEAVKRLMTGKSGASGAGGKA
jgi:hypothetical protein